MIPADTVARILDAAQVVEVVGDFVSLRRQGSDYVACCPFHNEKTPSFHVSPTKGIYKCFGCGKSGTAVGFVMEHEGMTYPEALKYLARKYGIEVVEKEETPEDIAARNRREGLMLVLDFAEKFFVSGLDTDEGRTIGMAYFRSRGLEDATIRKYGLGWAPKDRRSLREAALAKGFKEEYLLDLGLCVRYDDGRVLDKFYDRVVFPIQNNAGAVIGFGARTLLSDKTVAKYVNSPQSEVYDKSHTLYGINFAKSAIHLKDRCYLVEGYLDVLSMHQLGITNVVASSGTSLTVQQVRLIKKYTDNVTIMYDGDGAGIKAALRGVGLVLKEGLSVKVVLLPDGDDPDSFSRRHTLAEVEDFLRANERDFIEFKTDLLLGDSGNDPLKRAGLINDMADTIALIPDAVTRSVYCQTIASRFDMDAQIIFSRVRQTRDRMLADERKEAFRKGVGAPAREPVSGTEDYIPEERTEDAAPGTSAPEEPARSGIEYPLLNPEERELLSFILRYGLSPMHFETDSVYYQEGEETTVAAFISYNLESDGISFHNSLYRRAYDIYFDFYDNHPEMDQDSIVRAMMDGAERDVAALAAELTGEKYQLTVQKFADSMTAVSTQLVKFVPRSLLVYQLALIKFRRNGLFEKLKAGSDDVEGILADMQALDEKRKALDEALGRVR